MCLAVPGQVVTISGDTPLERVAMVDFGGLVKTVSLAYAPEAMLGDYVLVHVGFAIAVLDAAEASRLLDYLREIDALEAAEGEPAR